MKECAENPEQLQCILNWPRWRVPERVRLCLITGAIPQRPVNRVPEVPPQSPNPLQWFRHRIKEQSSAVRIPKERLWFAVIVLLAIQAAQMAFVVHRESLTFDEDDHMFAGYMMWHTGDYGRNDGASQRLVFRMRLTAGLLAIALSLLVFLAASEWFGSAPGLVALVLVTFDPNILAHSALVTTDVGVSLFFLAGIYSFYRYVKQPSLLRLLLAGVAAGLLLATKHSGILLAPMLLLLIGWELAVAPKGTRSRLALRLSGAFCAIVVVGVVVLWAFYGFRYAARPSGLQLSSSLADYAAPLSHFNSTAVLTIARFRLLPESYLMGLVDVKRMAEFYPTFIFGHVYAHGQWWYFPAVILIKTTLGLLALLALTAIAILTGRLRKRRELAFILHHRSGSRRQALGLDRSRTCAGAHRFSAFRFSQLHCLRQRSLGRPEERS